MKSLSTLIQKLCSRLKFLWVHDNSSLGIRPSVLKLQVQVSQMSLLATKSNKLLKAERPDCEVAIFIEKANTNVLG